MSQSADTPEERTYTDAQERLLKATLEIANEHGVDQATTRRIAERAGVNLQLIQYYFGGKDGMLLEAQEYIVERFFEEIGPAIAGASTLADAIRLGVHTTWDLAQTRPEIVQPDLLLQTVRAGQTEPVPGRERRTQRRIATLITEVLERTGESLKVPDMQFALLTASALGGLVLEYRVTGDREHVGAAVATLSEMLTGLIAS